MSNCFLWQAHAVKLHNETLIQSDLCLTQSLVFTRSSFINSYILLAIPSLGRASRSSFRKCFHCHYKGKRAEKKEVYCTFWSFKLVLNGSYCKRYRYIIIKSKKILLLIFGTGWSIIHLWTTRGKNPHAFYELF